MRLHPVSLPLLCAALFLASACDEPNQDEGGESGESGEGEEQGEEQGEEEGEEEGGEGGEQCEPAAAGVAPTFAVSFLGFPEIQGDELVALEGLDFDGPCVLEGLDYAEGQLSMELACDHPEPSDPDGARITITTAADGIPAGLEQGEGVDLIASAINFENSGGDQPADDEGWRELEFAVSERYSLSDDDGPVFGATINTLGGGYGPVTVGSAFNCPGWEFCSADDLPSIRGYLEVSTSESELEVHVGEVGTVTEGELAWDVSLFQSRLDPYDCHFGVSGDASLVRRPG